VGSQFMNSPALRLQSASPLHDEQAAKALLAMIKRAARIADIQSTVDPLI